MYCFYWVKISLFCFCKRLLDLPLYISIWSRGFQCSISARDPGPNYIDCISEVGTRDPIKIYRENQNVVLNTTFAQNHQYIYLVQKQITNSLDISLLLGQNRFILLLQRLLNLPYIFQLGPGSRLF